MALIQPVNLDAHMATADDPMEFSTESRGPGADDLIDIDIEDESAVREDQEMTAGDGGDDLIDDEMADGEAAAEPPALTVADDDGKDLELDDATHADGEDGTHEEGATPGVAGVPAADAKPSAATETAAQEKMPGSGLALESEAGVEQTEQGEEDEEDEDERARDGYAGKKPKHDANEPDNASESSDSPPPRRPAGKGPAGRAPQKTPAFSSAPVEDDGDSSSHDSADDSQDDANAPSGANATTEPSFTESAKVESESEDDSVDGETKPTAPRPEYHESEDDSDSESLVDHGPVHSIIVDYQGSKISLFPPQEDDEEHESYLLQDEGLCHEPLSHMLSECRHVLKETVLDSEELVLNIPCLGVIISEQIAETMTTTMTELVELFLNLSYNDGIGTPAALRVLIETREKCHARIEAIRSLIAEGKGLSHVYTHIPPVADPLAPPIASSKPLPPDDFGAGDNFSHTEGLVGSDRPATAADSFIPSEAHEFEEQFDVQTPVGDDPDPLGAGPGANQDFLDFTSPQKRSKDEPGQDGEFNAVFDGEFAATDDFIHVPEDDGGNLDMQAGDFGDTGNNDLLDTFDNTNDGGGVAEQGGTGNGDEWIQHPEDDFDTNIGEDNSTAAGGLPTIGDDATAGVNLANTSDAAAAEDAFTFLDDHGDSVEVSSQVGDPQDEAVDLNNHTSNAAAPLKRGRPNEDEGSTLDAEDPSAQTKRARAE